MHKLGRQARKFNTSIPRARAMIEAQGVTPQIPSQLDYTVSLPENLGEFLNDSLGDCTCAAFYHARQVWSDECDGGMITDSDADALKLYENACGYKPSDPSTDQGGVEQDVLAYLLNTGAPVNGGIDKILGYVEVDQSNLVDLRHTIAECGVAYIGINVPQSVMDNADDNTIPWDVHGNKTIVGGHAIVLAGYDDLGFIGISWGKKYKITNAFLNAHLDEAYGIIDKNWISSTGITPFGMTLEELERSMQVLKHAN